MIVVILWAHAAAGFWPGPSMEWRWYPDMETCHKAQPGVEDGMRWRGMTGIITGCKEEPHERSGQI
ncbi:MAG: hypothetical protein WC829_18210 [Hyphomicrobium sp.]|jgi:hypothetical protein